MPQAALDLRTVFLACVVSAVRAGEPLMGKLVEVTRNALTQEESSIRNTQPRSKLGEALSALKQHEMALLRGYPAALLDIFAEGPSNTKTRLASAPGMDFGELSLMDDSELHDQVEHARAQQLVAHATEAVLSELNTLLSSAQGLRSVQPERNPLRPENYIRALQRVVSETSVTSDVRQLWMQHMRGVLGKLLEGEYLRIIKMLHDQGVQPVGYAVLATPASTGGRSGYGALQSTAADYSGRDTSGHGHTSGYAGVPGSSGGGMGVYSGGAGDPQQYPVAAEAQEAFLTVGVLRQMLAEGDSLNSPGYEIAVPQVMTQSAGGDDAPGAAMNGASGPSDPAYAAMPAEAVDAMDEMAQLEQLVSCLAGGAQTGAPLPALRPPVQFAQPIFTVPFVAPTESPGLAAEVVANMMAALAQDARLLPPIQSAMQKLDAPLKQLVRFDPRFFRDAGHPARRLLDEVTQRSLAFATEDAPGFAQFVRLVNAGVAYLATKEIKDATPFETVLRALYSAWDTQEQRKKAQEAAQEQARRRAEQRLVLAERVAADIRKLPDLGNVPEDILDFAAGPWADVVALAQVTAEDPQDNPSGYLALVPVLLWSAQPELTRREPERLTHAIPDMLVKLRQGLRLIEYPADKASAFIARLVALHQAAFEASAVPAASTPSPQGDAVAASPDSMGSEPSAEDEGAQALPETTASQVVASAEDSFANFAVGTWVELISNKRPVRTQLTWTSPNGTLFLFTAPDGSTQSMTRRMRDKLAAEGMLRVIRYKPSSRGASSAPAELSRTPPKVSKGR